MEMMEEVSRGVYDILEKLAADQISKDPLEFLRRESVLKKDLKNNHKVGSHNSSGGGIMKSTGEGAEDDDDDMFKDAYDDEEYKRKGIQPSEGLYNP
jgi:hypothetical protein